MHEIQAIAAPGVEAERIALLVDVGLEHLLPERIFDAQFTFHLLLCMFLRIRDLDFMCYGVRMFGWHIGP